MKKLYLDAGHGYNTAGKRAPDGIREWTLNNAVCNYVQEFLKEYDVEVIRTDDITGKTDVPLANRINAAINGKADLLVSIHHNALSGRWGTHGGVEVYTDVENQTMNDVKFAEMVNKRLAKYTGLRNRGIKSANWMVINTKLIPAVLVEGGFMDSTTDYNVIVSEKGQKAYAQAIGEAVVEFLGLIKKTGDKPSNEATVNDSIMGESVKSAEVLQSQLEKKNPNMNPRFKDIAKEYIRIGKIYGVKGDIAFCQMAHETGWLKFGGQVLESQNNFCGLGATNGGAKGAVFDTVEDGVTAHIQHLFAYACSKPLPSGEKLLDPRFNLIKPRGKAPTWFELNGKWAVPGTTYAQSIIRHYNEIPYEKEEEKPIYPRWEAHGKYWYWYTDKDTWATDRLIHDNGKMYVVDQDGKMLANKTINASGEIR